MNSHENVTIEPWSTKTPHKGKVFAAVFPHSDDLAILAGGTVMKLISEGYTGYFIKITNDEKDSYDLSIAETIYKIALETQDVVDFLGLKKLYCFDYKNHYLEHSQLIEIRHRLMILFRFLKVDTVISFDPWGHYEENPDHYLTAHAVEAACWMAGRQLDLPELKDMNIMPKFVTEKYLVARGPQLVNHIVDITPVIDKKREVIKLHTTPLFNMWRTYHDLNPGKTISLEDFSENEFLRKSNEEFGIDYVEKFHYIANSSNFPTLK
jgi:LmbE family N-acetylglucosaminyl deacetylase